MESARHNPSWTALALALAVLSSVFLCACASITAATTGPAASANLAQTPQLTPETRSSIATAIALKAAESKTVSPKSTVTPDSRSVAEISATVAASGLLDNVHLARGINCEACHGPLPASGKPTPVTTTKCLSCHGGSYDAVSVKTSNLGSRNPHKAHTGKEDCDRCHHAHQAFEYSCNACHTFPIPSKYAPTSTQSASNPPPAQGDGGAKYKETED